MTDEPRQELDQYSVEYSESERQPEGEPDGFIGVNKTLTIVQTCILKELSANIGIDWEAVVAITL